MYISQIAVSGSTYDIKDAEARELIQGIDTAISGGLHYIGETSTKLEDGDTTSTLTAASANSLSKTTGFVAGDIVIYDELEFVWNGAKWHEFGSTGSLKGLAFKDEATGSATVTGSNNASAISFTGTTDANFVTGVDTAAVAPSFTEGAFDAGSLPSFKEGAFTPASLETGFYSAGTAATYSHSGFSGGSMGTATTGTFATEGVTASVAANSEVLTIGAASTSNAVTAQGEFTPASYGTDNFNGGTPTTIDVTKFNGGSKASDTFSAGTLPSKAADTFNAGSAATFSTAKAITGLGTATAAAQTWSMNSGSVTVS